MHDYYLNELRNGRMLIRGRVAQDPLWAHLRFYCLYRARTTRIVIISYRVAESGFAGITFDAGAGRRDDWEDQVVDNPHFRFDGEPQTRQSVVAWNTGDDSQKVVPKADPRLIFHEGRLLQALRDVAATSDDDNDVRICDQAIPKLEGLLRQQFKAMAPVFSF